MNKKKGVLIIAIALVLAFFVGYGIEVFNPNPQIEDERDFYQYSDESECITAGGEWYNERFPRPIEEGGKEIQGYCNAPYKKIELERSKHDRIVFIAAVLIGLIAVIVGLILKKDTISTGIVAGGVLLILYGTIRYWRHADNILKFILLGIVLAVLIWLGYKKLEDKG
jgi:hypothetical protein